MSSDDRHIIFVKISTVMFLLLISLLSSTTSAFGEGNAVVPLTPNEPFPGIANISSRSVSAYSKDIGPSFSPPNHKKQLELLTGLNRECTNALMNAQWYQDIVHQLESKAHFDNCDFDGSMDYIFALFSEAKSDSENNILTAMNDLGMALHAIQDFYAHSNYVEILVKEDNAFDDSKIIAVWDEKGRNEIKDLIEKKGLYSGSVWWSLPHNCQEGIPTHGELAKDSESGGRGSEITKDRWDNMSYYQVASKLSAFASRKFLHDAYIAIPVIKEKCGNTVGFLQMMDRRPK